jgi:hypothetical protein
MTGYLHRLVASARKPGGAIHPVLAPIFSFATPETAVEERDEASISAAPAAPPRSDAAEIPQPVLPQTAQPNASPAPNAPQPRDPAPGPFEQLRLRARRPQGHLVESALHPESNERRTPPAPRPGEAHPSNERPAYAARADEGARRETASSERSFAGLLPAQDRPRAPAAPIDRRALIDSPLSFATVTRQRDDVARSSPRPSSQPDDVHIHIGRIEVTAVQPVPARTAPAKPMRHAPSLDEYLKRRNGRAS